MGICPPNYARRMDPEWLGMKTVGKTPKLFSQPYFLTGNGIKNGNVEQKIKIGITGYLEQKSSIGNMTITIGNRELKTGIYM